MFALKTICSREPAYRRTRARACNLKHGMFGLLKVSPSRDELKKCRTWAPRVPSRMEPLPPPPPASPPRASRSPIESAGQHAGRTGVAILENDDGAGYESIFSSRSNLSLVRVRLRIISAGHLGERRDKSRRNTHGSFEKKERRKKSCPPIGAPFLSIQSSRPLRDALSISFHRDTKIVSSARSDGARALLKAGERVYLSLTENSKWRLRYESHPSSARTWETH